MKSGLSHSYIDSLEKGVHPKTKTPIKPSPDSLKSLASAYDYDYQTLMRTAGYLDEEVPTEYELSESELDRVVRETEAEFGVNLRDDPDVNDAFRDLARSLARMKKK
ncbi:hypothetical protein D3C71_1846870 [compost metagenome]